MIQKIKELVWFFPNTKVVSSQTLYHSIFALISLYEKTSELYYLNEAKILASNLAKLQNLDGGFNIGFNFLFGCGKLKPSNSSSTTPESLSIFAFYRLISKYKEDEFKKNIKKCGDWIIQNSYGDKQKSIAYCPAYTKSNHINNSNSFASIAMAVYDKLFSTNYSYFLSKSCYHALNKYDKGGSFYYYFNQYSLINSNELQLDKIDYPHMAQQAWCHLEAYLIKKNKTDLTIANEIYKYLKYKTTINKILPYCANPNHSPQNIPIWGISSIIIFFARWHQVFGDKSSLDIAKNYEEFLSKNAYSKNGKLFSTINIRGRVVDKNRFIRSEAWTCHAYALLFSITSNERYKFIFNSLFTGLKKDKFKGREPNRWTKRKYISLKFRDFVFFKKGNY